MGVGIAYVFAVAGWTTYVVEPNDAHANTLKATIAEVAQQGADRGKLEPGFAAGLPDAISCLPEVAALPHHLGLVVETVPERLTLKLDVLTQIEARQPGLIASNTSALSIDELAAALHDPSCFFGMHFFNPVWSLPLVEIVRGAKTNDASIEAASSIAHAIGKQSIVVTDTPGFATSRLDLIASLEAMRMVEAGVATASDIDLAMVTAYRHPIGPLRLSDIVGLDVRLDIALALSASLGERYAPPQILLDKVAAGHLGRKSGRGFFDWSDSTENT
jgi:3-hydroxybutyryl-CoA dehydrogenase